MPPIPPASPPEGGARTHIGLLLITLLLGYATGVGLAWLQDAPGARASPAGHAARPDETGVLARLERDRPAGFERASDELWPARERRLARIREGRSTASAGPALPTRRSVQDAIDATDPHDWLARYGSVVETPLSPTPDGP